ncbi:superoxide dismutase, Ni [Pseudoalteromonas denitrificans]|uniref:Nickel superoxide dismutase n=1 Tax=Pseudoalteromonas denitrificans DSM 6059 TaxID=1123010 RepID=A0A1I1HYI0_9GAMM|nr:superoxide dismutase, Ni [Pseudoalteromonas denitrificans]SFC28632.1 nickel superoxide dismutase [Pseudoalteromonas denitrificans DSM 6059]
MLFNLISKLDKKLKFSTASAHCDIPCKIYDPISAQIAVLTMIRMVDLLNDINEKSNLTANDQAQFHRLLNQKEEHGNKVKEEIRIIWGDYIKQPQLEKFPELHALTHSIMLASSKAKQHIDKDATLDLLNKVNRFAEIFWATKGLETYTAVCPYPPTQTLVYPKLN